MHCQHCGALLVATQDPCSAWPLPPSNHTCCQSRRVSKQQSLTGVTACAASPSSRMPGPSRREHLMRLPAAAEAQVSCWDTKHHRPAHTHTQMPSLQSNIPASKAALLVHHRGGLTCWAGLLLEDLLSNVRDPVCWHPRELLLQQLLHLGLAGQRGMLPGLQAHGAAAAHTHTHNSSPAQGWIDMLHVAIQQSAATTECLLMAHHVAVAELTWNAFAGTLQGWRCCCHMSCLPVAAKTYE